MIEILEEMIKTHGEMFKRGAIFSFRGEGMSSVAEIRH